MKTPPKKVSIVVNGDALDIEAEDNLLYALHDAGVLVPTTCQGKGVCHRCRIICDPAPPPSDLEKFALGNVLISKGFRLACRTDVIEGINVTIPDDDDLETRRAQLRALRRPQGEPKE